MEIVKIEQRAAYTLAGIHDGYIYGISMSDEAELELSFKNLQGDKWTMIVGGVVSLKVDDFRQGNIVDDVDFYEAGSCPLDLLDQVFGYEEKIRRVDYPPDLKCLDGFSWFIMEISPSYGCKLLVLSKNSIDSIVLCAIE